MTIIASTGCWVDPPATMRARSVDQLEAWFRCDLTVGVDGTGVRAGVIKLASDAEVQPFAATVLEAAARVTNETGAPIITHTAAAHRTGEAQADLLESFGVDPARVAIGHSDDSDDLGYLTGLASRGYRIAMDRMPNGALPDYGGQDVQDRIEMIARLVEHGYGDRVLLGHDDPIWAGLLDDEDAARHQASNPDGLAFVSSVVLPGLRRLGLAEEDVRALDRGEPAPLAGRGMTGPEEAHSIPWDLPLHGPPPARFRNGEVLAVLYRTERRSIAALVPAPLVPLGDTVLVQVARWGDVPGLGRDTHEVNVLVQVRFDGPRGPVTGAYSPYFFVDSDRAMAGGREFHGQPKRLAEVGLDVRGDLVVGTMRRNGIDVLTVTLPYKLRPGDAGRRPARGRLRHEHQLQGRAADRRVARAAPADRARPGRHRRPGVLGRTGDGTDRAQRAGTALPAPRGRAARGLLLAGRLLAGRRRGAARLPRGRSGGAGERDVVTDPAGRPALVAFGELLLRLDPGGADRIVQARSFEARYTGAEANVAASLRGFGIATEVVSAVPDTPVGRACINALRQYGVGTDGVLRRPGRLGLLFHEPGGVGRSPAVIYDRAGSVFATTEPHAYDWPALLTGRSWLHVSGTALALGAGVRSAVERALSTAHDLGLRTSLDLNYRASLWSPAAAGQALLPLVPDVDLLLGLGPDSAAVFGLELPAGEPALVPHVELARRLRERVEVPVVAGLVRVRGGATTDLVGVAVDADGVHVSPAYPVLDPVGRIGTGDAFAAGLLYGLLQSTGTAEAVEFGAAAAHLKQSVAGDINVVTVDEVRAVLAGGPTDRVRR